MEGPRLLREVFTFMSLHKLRHLCSGCGTQCGGFQFLLILELWAISFHALVVFGLGKDLLFKSVLGHCELEIK